MDLPPLNDKFAPFYHPTNGGAPDWGVTHAEAVTPDDDNDLACGVSRAIYVGVAGDLAVVFREDTEAVPITNMAAGWYPGMRVRRIMATGTTAEGILAFS